MYKIYFYRDRRGREPVADYLFQLAKKTDKDSKIKLNKISDYIEMLRINGTQAGEPYIKHIDGKIWELRPLRDRILFAAWVEGGYVLLHHFLKKTQKTPEKEIAKAKRELSDLLERGVVYE